MVIKNFSLLHLAGVFQVSCHWILEKHICTVIFLSSEERERSKPNIFCVWKYTTHYVKLIPGVIHYAEFW